MPAWATCPPCEHTSPQGDVDTTHQREYHHAAYYHGVMSRGHMEEAPDADGSSPPLPHPSCPDMPPDAQRFSPEAATPHAHLGLPAGWEVVTVPIAVLKREPTARVSPLRIVTSRRA